MVLAVVAVLTLAPGLVPAQYHGRSLGHSHHFGTHSHGLGHSHFGQSNLYHYSPGLSSHRGQYHYYGGHPYLRSVRPPYNYQHYPGYTPSYSYRRRSYTPYSYGLRYRPSSVYYPPRTITGYAVPDAGAVLRVAPTPRVYTFSTTSSVNSEQAWALLGEGRYRSAQSAFAALATASPMSGNPKVGYALATAGTGDLASGVWAMQRACLYDANALHYIKPNAELMARLQSLRAAYSAAATSGKANYDAYFMLAGLDYLLGDAAKANESIRLAGRGFASESTDNLQRLIAQRNAEQSTPLAESDATAAP